MSHKTAWRELQRFLYRCEGCSRECTAVCVKTLNQGENCDATRKSVAKVLKDSNATLQGGGY